MSVLWPQWRPDMLLQQLFSFHHFLLLTAPLPPAETIYKRFGSHLALQSFHALDVPQDIKNGLLHLNTKLKQTNPHIYLRIVTLYKQLKQISQRVKKRFNTSVLLNSATVTDDQIRRQMWVLYMTQSLGLCAKSLNNPVLDIVSRTLTVTVNCLNKTQVDKQETQQCHKWTSSRFLTKRVC